MRWGWFCGWCAVGAAAALGVISLGPITVIPAVLVALVLLSRDGGRRSAFGLLSGAGIVMLAVAWAQRDGPGTTCWHTATASGCDQHLDPIPWLVAGVVLLVAGILAEAVRQRRI